LAAKTWVLDSIPKTQIANLWKSPFLTAKRFFLLLRSAKENCVLALNLDAEYIVVNV